MMPIQANDVRLIYASRMTTGCGPRDLENILDVSRKNNAALGVTGALCYAGCGFLQCLEGPAKAVNEIYRRITQDARNEDVMLLTYSPITERAFGQWSMAFIETEEADRLLLDRHGVTGDFDPHTLNDIQALGLLIDLARKHSALLASPTRS